MKVEDFWPFYGVEVMLQFKDTIALAEAVGAKRPVPKFTVDGKMATAEGKEAKLTTEVAVQPTWPIGARRTEGKVEFTYILEGALVLRRDDGLLSVTYRKNGTLIELMVDPELILACQTVRDHPEESRLIAQA